MDIEENRTEGKFSNDEDQDDEQIVPSNPSFLGCEYLHIQYETEEQLNAIISLTTEEMENLDLEINLDYEESDSDDEMDSDNNFRCSSLSSKKLII